MSENQELRHSVTIPPPNVKSARFILGVTILVTMLYCTFFGLPLFLLLQSSYQRNAELQQQVDRMNAAAQHQVAPIQVRVPYLVTYQVEYYKQACEETGETVYVSTYPDAITGSFFMRTPSCEDRIVWDELYKRPNFNPFNIWQH